MEGEREGESETERESQTKKKGEGADGGLEGSDISHFEKTKCVFFPVSFLSLRKTLSVHLSLHHPSPAAGLRE